MAAPITFAEYVPHSFIRYLGVAAGLAALAVAFYFVLRQNGRAPRGDGHGICLDFSLAGRLVDLDGLSPIVWSFYLSFTEYDVLRPRRSGWDCATMCASLRRTSTSGPPFASPCCMLSLACRWALPVRWRWRCC